MSRCLFLIDDRTRKGKIIWWRIRSLQKECRHLGNGFYFCFCRHKKLQCKYNDIRKNQRIFIAFSPLSHTLFRFTFPPSHSLLLPCFIITVFFVSICSLLPFVLTFIRGHLTLIFRLLSGASSKARMNNHETRTIRQAERITAIIIFQSFGKLYRYNVSRGHMTERS